MLLFPFQLQWFVFNFLPWLISFRSAESSQHFLASERNDGNDAQNAAPLNLSTKSQDQEKQPEHLLRAPDSVELKGNELPLNLSLRPSQSDFLQSSALNTSENVPPACDEDQDEEQRDQRQTAALALCQLATANSASSLCGFNSASSPSEDSISLVSPKTSVPTTRTKATRLKRPNSGQVESKCQKLNKKAKTSGRSLRRRPRC